MKSVDHSLAEVPGIVNFSVSLPHLQIQPPTLKTLKCCKLSCAETSAGLSLNSDGHSSRNERIKKEREDGQVQIREGKNKKTQQQSSPHTAPEQRTGFTSLTCFVSPAQLWALQTATNSC